MIFRQLHQVTVHDEFLIQLICHLAQQTPIYQYGTWLLWLIWTSEDPYSGIWLVRSSCWLQSSSELLLLASSVHHSSAFILLFLAPLYFKLCGVCRHRMTCDGGEIEWRKIDWSERERGSEDSPAGQRGNVDGRQRVTTGREMAYGGGVKGLFLF